MLKILQTRLQRMWSENFQMYKSDLEKAEDQRSNCQHLLDHRNSKSSRNISISALLTMTKPLTVWITTNWKILKEMGISDHLTFILRNLYAGQEAIVRTGCGTTDWFEIGIGVPQGYVLSPYLFNLYSEYIMRTLGWMKHKLESRLMGEISETLDMQMTPSLWQKVKRN